MQLLRVSQGVLLSLLVGCQSNVFEVDRPPIERSAREGQVCAWSDADADRVAAELDRLTPAVRALKAVECERPLVIVTHETLLGDVDGMATSEVIFLGPDSRMFERFVLAHELAHYYRDDVWRLLPHAVEEGLADLVAEELEPNQGSFVLLPRLTNIPLTIDRALLVSVLSAEHSLVDPPEQTIDMQSRAIGFVVAIALGLDELRKLCERVRDEGLEQMPADWILDKMPFPLDDPAQWHSCIIDYLKRPRS